MTNALLLAYNNTLLNTKSMVTLNCTFSKTGDRKPVLFHVIETRSSPLLSLQTSLEFDLIQVSFAVESQNSNTFLTKQKILRDFPDLFKEIDCIDNVPTPAKQVNMRDATLQYTTLLVVYNC